MQDEDSQEDLKVQQVAAQKAFEEAVRKLKDVQDACKETKATKKLAKITEKVAIKAAEVRAPATVKPLAEEAAPAVAAEGKGRHSEVLAQKMQAKLARSTWAANIQAAEESISGCDETRMIFELLMQGVEEMQRLAAFEHRLHQLAEKDDFEAKQKIKAMNGLADYCFTEDNFEKDVQEALERFVTEILRRTFRRPWIGS